MHVNPTRIRRLDDPLSGWNWLKKRQHSVSNVTAGAPRPFEAVWTSLISAAILAVLAAFAGFAAGFLDLLTRRVDGTTPTMLVSERVAQLVEHLTFNQEVAGSIPAALTSKIKCLA
jgi:hypothetical protein